MTGHRFVGAIEGWRTDYSAEGTGNGISEELWEACFSLLGMAGVGVVQPQLRGEEHESQPQSEQQFQ